MSASPVAVDQTHPRRLRHRALERVHTVGRVRTRVGDRERVGEPSRATASGSRRCIGATQSSDSDELHDQTHDRRGGRVVGLLGAVRTRGLEPVMAIGQDERAQNRPRRGSRSMRAVSVIGQASWRTPASSTAVKLVVVGLADQRGEARRARQTPDRVEVGTGRPQQRQPVGAVPGDRALVRKDVAGAGAAVGQAEGPDDSVRDPRRAAAAGVGELHPVAVERRRGVEREHAVGAPASRGARRRWRTRRRRRWPAGGSAAPRCGDGEPRETSRSVPWITS